jgi:hypothetical protein
MADKKEEYFLATNICIRANGYISILYLFGCVLFKIGEDLPSDKFQDFPKNTALVFQKSKESRNIDKKL